MIYEYYGRLYPDYLKRGNACQFVAPLARQFCRGTGLDIGAGQWPLAGATPIELTNGGDAMALPEGTYDYVFSSHCLEHLVNPVAAIEHWKTRLRPGGFLFLYLPHPDMTYWLPQHNRKHLHAWRPEEIAQILRDLGFADVIHSERDLAWSFAVVGRKPCIATGIARAFKARVAEIGGPRIFHLSALSIRDGAGVLEHVLGSGRYRTVLEIGTYHGVGTAFMAKFVDKVITIDLAQGRLEQEDRTFDRKAFWKALGVADKIDLRLVKSNEEKAALIRSLKFDLAFIDGGKEDVAADFASVQHCGAVLFHDYDDRGQPSLNVVYDFVNSLSRNQVQVMDLFALWTA